MGKRKNKIGDVSQEMFALGKIPPNAVELEEAVLGALMLDRESVTNIIDILSPQAFYKEIHQIIFEEILGLFKRGEPIDILTVTNAVKAQGKLEKVGGAYYISQLTNRVASSANAEFHARIILQKYMARQLIANSANSIKDCYEDDKDVFEILDKAQTYLNDIVTENIKSQGQDTTQAFSEFIHHLEKASQNTEKVTGIPTTIKELDKITNGFQNSDLIIVAGRPGSGKSAWTKSAIRGCIEQRQLPVAVFSLEMSTLQNIARLVSEHTGATTKQLLQGQFQDVTNFNFINNAITNYYSTETGKPLLFIDDSPSMTITEMRAKAKRLHNKYGIGLIVVDYLQLMSGGNDDSENRVFEVGRISRGLKTLAKELNIPVIALSQLSRAVETRGGDMRPRLSDLRESGNLEQDADIVMFTYRPGYYFEQGDQRFATVLYKGMEISSEGFAEMIIAKHRNGAIGTVAMQFNGRLTQFKDWEDGTYRAGDNMGTSNPTPPVQPPEDGGSSNKIAPNPDFFKKDDLEEAPF